MGEVHPAGLEATLELQARSAVPSAVPSAQEMWIQNIKLYDREQGNGASLSRNEFPSELKIIVLALVRKVLTLGETLPTITSLKGNRLSLNKFLHSHSVPRTVGDH